MNIWAANTPLDLRFHLRGKSNDFIVVFWKETHREWRGSVSTSRLDSVISGSEKLSPVTSQNSIPDFYRIRRKQKTGCEEALFFNLCFKNNDKSEDALSIADKAECSF